MKNTEGTGILWTTKTAPVERIFILSGYIILKPTISHRESMKWHSVKNRHLFLPSVSFLSHSWEVPYSNSPSLTMSWNIFLKTQLSSNNSARFCSLLSRCDLWKLVLLLNTTLWSDLILACSGIPETCLTALQKNPTNQRGGGEKLSAPISFNHSTHWRAF